MKGLSSKELRLPTTASEELSLQSTTKPASQARTWNSHPTQPSRVAPAYISRQNYGSDEKQRGRKAFRGVRVRAPLQSNFLTASLFLRNRKCFRSCLNVYLYDWGKKQLVICQQDPKAQKSHFQQNTHLCFKRPKSESFPRDQKNKKPFLNLLYFPRNH